MVGFGPQSDTKYSSSPFTIPRSQTWKVSMNSTRRRRPHGVRLCEEDSKTFKAGLLQHCEDVALVEPSTGEACPTRMA